MSVEMIQKRCLSALLETGALLRHRQIAVVLLLVLLASVSPQIVRAQSDVPEERFGPSLRPNNQLPRWIIDEIVADGSPVAGVTAAETRHSSLLSSTHPITTTSLIIDSDFGVDDTVAVAALISLQQGIATITTTISSTVSSSISTTISTTVDIQALVTVAGVTTVENATYNAELLLAQYGLTVDDIPVIVGAKKPQKQKLSSTGKLIHGPDGLWWLAQITEEQAVNAAGRGKKGKGSTSNSKNFYCKEAELEGATLLTLGPLTNVAEAIKHCKKTFENAEGLRLIVLGGVDMTGTEPVWLGNETPIVGNMTPVTEYNFWQDPEAAQYVFDFAKPKNPYDEPSLDITVIPQNTFAQYVLTDEIQTMADSDNALGRWLTLPDYADPYTGFPGPLPLFASIQSENSIAPVPDLVAAAYAVDPSFRASSSVTPSVVTIFGDSKASGLVGGESLMAQSMFNPEYGVFIGTPEQISQVYDDKALSELADAVFDSGEPFDANFGLLWDFFDGFGVAPPNNAQVVVRIESALVRTFLLDTLTAPFSLNTMKTPVPLPQVSDSSKSIEDLSDDALLDEQIFLPVVAGE